MSLSRLISETEAYAAATGKELQVVLQLPDLAKICHAFAVGDGGYMQFERHVLTYLWRNAPYTGYVQLLAHEATQQQGCPLVRRLLEAFRNQYPQHTATICSDLLYLATVSGPTLCHRPRCWIDCVCGDPVFPPTGHIPVIR